MRIHKSKNKIVCLIVAMAFVLSLPVVLEASTASKAWAAGKVSSLDAKANGKAANASSTPVPMKSPTRAIKDLDAMLDDFKTGTKLSEMDEEHNRELKMKIIHGTFDIRELSKLSLAKHWNKLTEAQRDHFVDLMVSLLEEKALFSKEQSAAKSKSGGKYKVLYRGHKFLDKAKNKSFVRTKVLVPSENIDIILNYKLKNKDGQWKIYDVIVDEASLVANYKFQFNSIITKHGYDELVDRMTKKLDEIKTERRTEDS